MKGGATSAASCCVACNNSEGCKAFTFLSGACFLKKCKTPSAVSDNRMRGAISAFLK